MPASYAFSSSYTRTSTVADAALNDPEGVVLNFTTDNCGSFDGAKAASKRFQTAFCTMRVRERNRLQRQRGENIHVTSTDMLGRYDVLSCYRTPLPNQSGYEVRLTRAHLIDLDVPVISISTGQEIRELGRQEAQMTILNEIFAAEVLNAEKEQRRTRNPFTEPQMAFIRANDPEQVPWLLENFKIDISEKGV